MKKKITLFFIALLLIFIVGCEKEDELSNELITNDNLYTMYIQINPTIKLVFNESYKKCDEINQHNKCELKTKIVDFELVNEDAKKILKDIEIKEKDVLDVIPMIVDNIHDNNINFSNINITTNWENGYEKDVILNKIFEDSKYNRDYNIVIKKVEQINLDDFIDSQTVSKKIKKKNVPLLVYNTDVLSEKELNPALWPDNNIYTIEVFGKKEVIDNLDLEKLDLYFDCNELSDLSLETDITGAHELNVYLDTDEDIYYSITPSKAKIGLSYYPHRDMNSITNKEIKNILNKYKLSSVFLTLNGNEAVKCTDVEGTFKCRISTDYQIDEKPTKELFLIYDRFNITYDYNGIPLNLKANWCSSVMPLSTCLDQTWFEI